jgi:uncharacterized membrane protein YccC
VSVPTSPTAQPLPDGAASAHSGWRPRARAFLRERADAFAASDPGLNRLLQAAELVVGLAATIAVIHAFVQWTHALWIEAPAGAPAAVTAQLAAQHHGVTLLAMIIGGIVALLSAFAVQETAPREQAITMALMPVPVLAMIAVAVLLVPHHVAGIVVMAVVMGLGTYGRKFVPRFGPRAFLCGALLFVGYLFGFLSNGAVEEHQLGWIAAVLWIAVAINLALKLAIWGPLARRRLDRVARAFHARCRGVIAAAAELFDADGPRSRERARRRLHRRLTRLNETALVIDAMIGVPDALDGDRSPLAAHHALFSTELVVQNVGRLTEALTDAELPPRAHAEVARVLRALRGGGTPAGIAALADPRAGLDDATGGRLQRLAQALDDWTSLQAGFADRRRAYEQAAAGLPFESAVTLVFGNLPGSALVSSAAATERSEGRRLAFSPPAQTAIRVALAVGAAAALGSILSERRFYWAVIAVFIAFMGANTSGEQVTKAFNRVLGTVVGILLGSLLAHAIGTSAWAIVVIIGALACGVYLMAISYAFMVVGVTVMVSQLYEQLGEYSGHLLVLRLEETAIGAAVAMLAALVVFPVKTRRATAIAARDDLGALEALLGTMADRLAAPEAAVAPLGELTGAVRRMDHASQQLLATARPLARGPFRAAELGHNLGLFGQAGHHARNAAAAIDRGVTLDPRVRGAAIAVLRAQQQAAGRLASIVDGEDDVPAQPPLRERLDTITGDEALRLDVDERLMLRHLDRLDETLAELGANLERRPQGRPGPVEAATAPAT